MCPELGWKSEGEIEEINGGIKPSQNKICVFPHGEMKKPEEGWRDLAVEGKTGVPFQQF